MNDLAGDRLLRSDGGSKATEPVDAVEVGVRARDEFAAGFEGVSGVEGVARGEAGANEKLAGPVDHGLVGDGELEVQPIESLPKSGQSRLHLLGESGAIAAVGGEWIRVAVVAEPGEEHPVEEFVNHQGAEDSGVA